MKWTKRGVSTIYSNSWGSIIQKYDSGVNEKRNGTGWKDLGLNIFQEKLLSQNKL